MHERHRRGKTLWAGRHASCQQGARLAPIALVILAAHRICAFAGRHDSPLPTGRQRWNVRAALDAILRKGTGIVFIHYALDCGDRYGKYMLDWIGG